MKPSGQLRRAPIAIRRRGDKLAPRRPRDTGPDRDTTAAVYARDGLCVLAGAALPAPAAPGGTVVFPCESDLSKQHRVARQAGGSPETWINDPANLAVVCGDGSRGHHGWLEDHATYAEQLGLSVRRRRNSGATFAAVLSIPVYWRGTWVLLTRGATTIELCPWDPVTAPTADSVAELAAGILPQPGEEHCG